MWQMSSHQKVNKFCSRLNLTKKPSTVQPFETFLYISLGERKHNFFRKNAEISARGKNLNKGFMLTIFGIAQKVLHLKILYPRNAFSKF